MNSLLLVSLVVIVLVVGSTLSIMNKGCKSGYQSTVRHHVRTPPPT
jgi:choline-glycine betaine transporter